MEGQTPHLWTHVWTTPPLFLFAAQSLTCYTCHEPITTSECTMIRNCSSNETMCKTTLYSREDGMDVLPTRRALCSHLGEGGRESPSEEWLGNRALLGLGFVNLG